MRVVVSLIISNGPGSTLTNDETLKGSGQEMAEQGICECLGCRQAGAKGLDASGRKCSVG